MVKIFKITGDDFRWIVMDTRNSVFCHKRLYGFDFAFVRCPSTEKYQEVSFENLMEWAGDRERFRADLRRFLDD